MPRLRDGRGQLNIANVSTELIKEFDDARSSFCSKGFMIPRWQFFERVWKDWCRDSKSKFEKDVGKAFKWHISFKKG